MEHMELPHAMAPENAQLSSFLTHFTPKTRCNHCCLHQCSPHSREEVNRPTVTSFCNSNFCTQTCFSSNQRYSNNRSPSDIPAPCNCHRDIQRVPSYLPSLSPIPPPLLPQPPPPMAVSVDRCPCLNRQHVDVLEEFHRYHISRATENLTFPPPQYAMAHFATSYAWTPSPHNWERAGGYREREYHHDSAHPYSISAGAQEYHTHIHRHVNQHNNVVCTNQNQGLPDQALYTFASRPYRRHASRLSSHPYPRHHPIIDYRVYPNVYPYLLTPRTHLHFPSGLSFSEEYEVELLDGELIDGGTTEPVGLKKEQIDKLPSYVVTKKTMEEFTENERCVVCMCEFGIDDKLRILQCAHEFHTACVDKWLLANPTCPICRAVVSVT